MRRSTTSAFAAVRTLPTPGPSGYVDRESSVVVAFPTNLGRQVAMTLAAPFAPTNALEVGLGWDRNGNGDLEPEETEVRMGVDCGVSQVKVESKAKVEVEQRNLSAEGTLCYRDAWLRDSRAAQHRQSHGHRPELDLDVAFLAVRVELDVVLVPHDALAGKPVDLVHAFPCEDAAARHADDEVPRIVDESPVERGSVAERAKNAKNG